MRHAHWLPLTLLAALFLAGCGGPDLETRTFEVRYLTGHQVQPLIEPYIYGDREGAPGMLSTAEGAVTVRETPDNLDKIARVLGEYDRPKPTVMLHFQIVEADGAAASDPAIAEVERELRRLFRFEGYELVAETRVAAIQGTGVRQLVGEGSEQFMIEGGVTEVRARSGDPTLTLDVGLSAADVGRVLETSVTIPSDHSIVLGTANAPGFAGALILVVRAEIVAAPQEEAAEEAAEEPGEA